jgi:hypothetical protein
MKMYGGVDVQIHVFLTSALDGGEQSASRSSHFTPGKEPPVPMDRRMGEPHSHSGQYAKVKILDITATQT